MTHICLGVVDRRHDAALVRARRLVPVLDRLPRKVFVPKRLGRAFPEETSRRSRTPGAGSVALTMAIRGVGHGGLVCGGSADLRRRQQSDEAAASPGSLGPPATSPAPPSTWSAGSDPEPEQHITGQHLDWARRRTGQKNDIHLGLDLVPRQEGRAVLDPALVEPERRATRCRGSDAGAVGIPPPST